MTIYYDLVKEIADTLGVKPETTEERLNLFYLSDKIFKDYEIKLRE